MNPSTKKVIRILKYVLLFLLLLVILFVGLINLPFVQRKITGTVNNTFSKNGLPIHVGELSFLLNGKIEIHQLEIKSRSGDTIVYAGNVNVSLSPIALFSNRILIYNVELSEAVVNLLTDKNSGE